jgi:hypothetical protein
MSNPLLFAASTVDPATVTSHRAVATAAVLVALAGAVVGGIALARPTTHRVPFTALLAGAVGAVVGTAVLATADGGVGTGNGVVGGYVGIALGLIAGLLGALALHRSRRRA